MRTLAASALVLLLTVAVPAQEALPEASSGAVTVPAETLAVAAAVPLTVDAINAADLMSLPAQYVPPVETDPPTERHPDPAVIRLQVLLDRAGASPGVIDGFDGDNVRKAIVAFELMQGLPADGLLDPDLLALLDAGGPVFGSYEIMPEDVANIGGPIPADYAEQATLSYLGYASPQEALAERFHMDIDLLVTLNPGAAFAAGEEIVVAAYGPDRSGEVVRIEADKSLRQVRAYDASGLLVVAYPATIGSEDNPSPSGSHVVEGVAPMPDYTYNPNVNFQQGENTDVLILPPGPNGPVGSMWIDLSEPTFGIHGTPEPSKIDKTASHGCVRLTNWDANELAAMVKPGVVVDFVG